MRYKKPFIPLKVTATCNILTHAQIHPISHLPSIVVYHHRCSPTMSTTGSPPKTANMTSPGIPFVSRYLHVNISASLDNSSQNTTGKDSRSGKDAHQYHPPHWYGYPPSQQPFPGALQIYLHSPFIIRNNSLQRTTSVSQRFLSYGPQWQGYDLHQGGYGGSKVIPPQEFTWQVPSSPGAPRVWPGALGSNPVNRQTSSSSTPPPGPLSSAPWRAPNSLQTTRSLPPAEPRKTDVASIADLPPGLAISYDDYDMHDERDDLSDLGSV